MRATYRDPSSVDVGNGVMRASLHLYLPAEARYASIPDGDGWLVLVDAPAYWHAALLEIGFAVTETPVELDSVVFLPNVVGGGPRGTT